ncbi:MAG: TadE family type IV pilus minor pilin [Actinomycetes bacterium]
MSSLKAGRPRPGDRGAVTAETAVLVPAFGLLLVIGLWAVSVLVLQLRCVDAARTGARALARGESDTAARAATAEVAPDGARIRIGRFGSLVSVDVEVSSRLPLAGDGPGGLDLGSRAVAAAEQP